MRMNKLYKAMFALAATGTLLPVAPALAAAPDPGPGWVLTSQRTVRSWVPEAGAGWVLVGQRPVTEFVPDPVSSPLPSGANGAGHWEMVAFRDRNYFVADSAITRKLVASTPQGQYVGAGTQRFDAERVEVSRTPREVRTDLKNPSKEKLDNGIYEVYKLVKFENWDDVQYKSPIWNMKQQQTRNQLSYHFQWSDGIYGTLMSEPDPKLDYTAWGNVGGPVKDSLSGYVDWDALVKEKYVTNSKDVLLAKVPLSLASNEAAKAKSATFLSDSGSGGSATSVAGSQKRAVFKADEAIVSETKKETTGGTGAGNVNLPSDNTISLPKPVATPTPVPGVIAPTPAPVLSLPTPAPVVASDKGFTMEDWIGSWKSVGRSGNSYDYLLNIKKYSNKSFQYNFDSWFNADKFDRMGPTSYSNNGSFTDEKKKEHYKDGDGWLNCDLKLDRDKSGKLKLKGTVTIYETDLLGFKTKNKKTYDVELTK
ncbi:hypothetical protein J7643_16910 [bacterium]|nr:hypothetical protein [bacterium]